MAVEILPNCELGAKTKSTGGDRFYKEDKSQRGDGLRFSICNRNSRNALGLNLNALHNLTNSNTQEIKIGKLIKGIQVFVQKQK